MKWAEQFNNKVILKQVIEARALGAPTPELCKTYVALTDRYLGKPNWLGREHEHLHDEYRSHALLRLMESGLKFNPEKSQNPFAFFITIIQSAIIYVYDQERRQKGYRFKKIEAQEEYQCVLPPSPTFSLPPFVSTQSTPTSVPSPTSLTASSRPSGRSSLAR